ncbi:hypothetical protein [Kordia sp.]|uniref:toxin-antitoxin system YwqK family antitoxin n=1 Tax=Kordia sp. TaxID=1965332 RepID=UPI003B5C7366
MRKKTLIILLVTFQWIAAQSDAFIDEVTVKDTKVYYNGALFSGNLYEYKEEAQTPNKCISKCEYLDGVRHGLSNYWYLNGKLKSEANYEHGKSIGVHRVYFENGSIQQIKSYENGVTIKDELFYETGYPKHVKNYNTAGKKQGKFIIWHETKAKAIEENFENGLRDQSQFKYDSTGNKVSEKIYIKGTLTATKTFYTSGHLKSWKEFDLQTSKLTLHRTYFDTNEAEIFIQKSYKNELLHGKQISKNELGELISEQEYIEGNLLSSKIYKNNKLSKESAFLNNFQTEKTSNYNDNETLESVSFLTNNKKDSVWYTYFPNGEKRTEISYINDTKEWEGQYTNNQKDGVWIYYHNQSLNQVYKTYTEGQLVTEETFEKVHLLSNRINEKNTFAYKNRITDETIILVMDDTFSNDSNAERVQYTIKQFFDRYFDNILQVTEKPYQLIDKFIYVQNLELSKKETIHERRKNRFDKNAPIIREKGYDFFIVFHLFLTNREGEELYNKTEKVNKSGKMINSLLNSVAKTYAKTENEAIERAFKSFTLKRFFRKNFKKSYKKYKN